MAIEDLSPRPAPRFVPTLTEVVANQPDAELAEAELQAPAPSFTSSDASLTTAEPPGAVAAVPAPSAEAIAAALLQQVGADLDRQISEAIARVLHEQMLGLNSRVQKAVAEVVRDAVATALARGMAVSDVGKNP